MTKTNSFLQKSFFILPTCALALALSVSSFAFAGQKSKTATTGTTTTATPTHLTPEEQAILDAGEIPQGEYIAGGVVGTLIGFGIGQGIQGRYGSRGWIFTVGDVVSLGMLIGGAASCASSVSTYDPITETYVSSGSVCGGGSKALIVSGYLLYLGFRIWETVDAWVVPPEINEDYRRVKEKAQANATHFIVLPVVVRQTPGLSLAMTF